MKEKMARPITVSTPTACAALWEEYTLWQKVSNDQCQVHFNIEVKLTVVKALALHSWWMPALTALKAHAKRLWVIIQQLPGVIRHCAEHAACMACPALNCAVVTSQ